MRWPPSRCCVLAIRAGAIRPALGRWRPLLAFAALEMAIPWFLLTDAERHLPVRA